ncbi:helix-turn-helix domain-containing protein [Chlorobium sp. BLA1]|uniref:helix-turn-helix domain-containing protein n=1 Tax=Candidatus Chlorobium masyuteum TaxID=2716876 RepID=UPI0014237563|nr:helix-turn-helix domain-containing protein [Candidatus Chlorobium masyuteum]NHQ60593.1 helix-turn-helix domain-containing protein [Candidatus Chlorobium masyuteum]
METIPPLQKPKRKFINLDSLVWYAMEIYDLPISKISIYRAVKSGSLPSTKKNGRLLFRITDVEKWIEGTSEKMGGA